MNTMTNSKKCVLKALESFGISEVKGRKSNKKVIEMIKRLWPWAGDDEIPWCSAFMNAVAGDLNIERTGTMVARDWLKVGEQVDEPKMGDVVVLWRGSKNSWKGHVGLFIRKEAGVIWILGGNQSNAVNIQPYAAYRLLGYRRLRERSEL